MMKPQSLRSLQNEDEYETALKEVRRYFENEPPYGSDAATRFDALAALVEDYEAKHYPELVLPE